MPPRIEPQGGRNVRDHMDLKDIRLRPAYRYPGKLDLRPGSPIHDLIVDEVQSRAQESFDVAKQHHDTMREMDSIMTAFIPIDQVESAVKAKDSRTPVSIVLPITYSIKQAIHTQYLALMASMDELHRFAGRGPEDLIGAMLAEKAILAQSQYFKELLTLSVQFEDILKYGKGAVIPIWTKEFGFRNITSPSYATDPVTGEPVDTGFTETSRQPVLKFAGNKVYNIDPYLLLTDPNSPATDVDSMEYVGYESLEDRMSILSREATDERWFNGRYIKHLIDQGQYLSNTRVDEVRDAGGQPIGGRRYGRPGNESRSNPIDVTYMFATIIPAEWNDGNNSALGKSEFPEKWFFAVAGDQLVLSAQRLDLDHDQFPICIAAPESDGYSSTPLALLEVTRGEQQAADFLWNSHMAFTRKMLRGRFIGDPQRVNVNDVLQGADFIRVNRIAWNAGGIDGALKQVQIVDTTQSNIPNIGLLQDFAQRATGATDPIQGIMRAQGERRTAEEARGARLGAMSRIEKMALLAGLQSTERLGMLMLSQTSQFIDDSMWVRVMGRFEDEILAEYGKRRVDSQPGFAEDWQGMFPIHPRDLDIYADVVPLDITSRGAESMESWVQLYSIIAGNPMLMQTLDTTRIFMHIARLGGAKNLSDFKLPMTPPVVVMSMPASQVLTQQQKGNMIPLQEAAANYGQ